MSYLRRPIVESLAWATTPDVRRNQFGPNGRDAPGSAVRARGEGGGVGWQPGGVLLGWRRAARRGAGMALCYNCSGTARHVCSGIGVQGDGRVGAICGGSGKCTHCGGGLTMWGEI